MPSGPKTTNAKDTRGFSAQHPGALLLGGALLMFAVLYAIITYYASLSQALVNKLQGEKPRLIWSEVVDNRISQLQNNQFNLTRNEELKRALLAGGRDQIAQAIATNLRRLRAMNELLDIKLISPGGEVLFDSHGEEHGLPLDDRTLKFVVQNPSVSEGGFILHDAGRISLAYRFPIYVGGGELAAIALFEHAMESVLFRFQAVVEGEVYFYASGRFIYASDTSLNEALLASVDFTQPEGVASFTQDERSFSTSMFHVPVIGNSTKVQLIAVQDQTEWVRLKLMMGLGLAVAMIVIVSVVFFLFYRYAMQAEAQRIAAQRRQIKELGRINEERTRTLSVLESTHQALRNEISERRSLEEEALVLSRAVEQSPVAIAILDTSGAATYVNPRFSGTTGFTPDEVMGSQFHPAIMGEMEREELAATWKTAVDEGEWRGVIRCKKKCGDLLWESALISVIRNPEGAALHYLVVKEDITQRKIATDNIRREKAEQEKLIEKLEEAHNQLLQSEKMASIGQLAAGVAHEINNPVGFVSSNLNTLSNYVNDLLTMIDAYGELEKQVADGEPLSRLLEIKQSIDLEYLREDVIPLLEESKEGLARVKKIVLDLKEFSHVGKDEWEFCDLHKGLDSTLNVVWNEIKYKAEVVKRYGELPAVECIYSQLNQVFMNLMVNAAHSIEKQGVITLRTGREGDRVWVEVEDTGCGISEEHLKKIFDPFFTTKAVGKGTGLGLSLSYGIVNKHNGKIEAESQPGVGTKIRVTLPIHHADKTENAVMEEIA